MADEILKRFGTQRESAARLGRKAAEAQQGIGIHGVSVTTGACDTDHSVAPLALIEAHFRVHRTPNGRDPLHYTIELPKPVSAEIASLFNRLFGR